MGRDMLIVRGTQDLREHYDQLRAGDLVVGRIGCRPSEEYILFDLVDRGVTLFPSALSQLVSRSKVFQATIYANWMLPNTIAVHDIHQLQRVLQGHLVGENQLITKLDRKNAGRGVFRWSLLEDIFTQASLGVLPFPFVIQEYIPECRDIRIVVLGGYREAYWRENDFNFRNNMYFGGVSTPCSLTAEQDDLCREVMERGKFPYAHIDLMVTPDGNSFLSEINLKGGIKGAKIACREYGAKISRIHQDFEEHYRFSGKVGA